MKYSELISFHPIEDVIQLTSANDTGKAKEYVQTFVMTSSMAENLKTLVLDQLRLEGSPDSKGILVVGNYGTGKSHLMSVISAVASDASYLPYLRNQSFAKDAQCIAGQFEVLRFELTGVTMPLREIVLGFIEDDFKERKIRFKAPDFSKVKDNKKLMEDVMAAFGKKYPGKGYLIVVDELLNFLASRTEQQLVMDLEFLRILGEMCSRSRLRCMFGMQEKLFDNPRFGFVADTLAHVRDRITELVIAKEDTAYVVSERILKKTPEQKEKIRAHLEKFSPLYTGMAARMDEFVDMFPIHPAYVDIFNRVYLIENRHILKNISITIREVFDRELPEDEPGIISFDDYWPKIKQTPMLRTNPEVRRVLEASEKLEDIITHAFPKAAYKPLAIKIIYALSVHRLTTNGLDVRFGLTAENLKDDLCLYLPMPEQDGEFLLGVINATLKEIMSTVSGQFIIFNESNSQYFIDVNKTVDYDERIRQRATLLSDDDLNRTFYQVVYSCLEWDARQYVTNFEIYERDLNWNSRNIFREGYLFMGLPGERSTAQPERDFYMHIMPPYTSEETSVRNLPDEVYFYFRSTPEFREMLGFYSAANALAQISEGSDRETYLSRASQTRKKLIRFLSENKSTCFEVSCRGVRRPMTEVVRGHVRPETDFKDTIDLAASICLEDCFLEKYPDFPVMKTRITRKNMAENVRQAFDYFAGRKSALAASMLQSFDLLDGERIRPEGSRYACWFIDKLRDLPPRGVLNYEDLFEPRFMDTWVDKHFQIPCFFTPIIFLSLVYGGFATITLQNGEVITASTLDQVPRILSRDLYEFKYLSRPAQTSVAELKRLCELLLVNPELLDTPGSREEGVQKILEETGKQCRDAVIAGRRLREGFECWGEPLVSPKLHKRMLSACTTIQEEFSNYPARYSTPARLNNFSLSMEQVEALGEAMNLIRLVQEYLSFRNGCSELVSYMARIEYIQVSPDFGEELETVKAAFRRIRDNIASGLSGERAADSVNALLEKVRDRYVDFYCREHQKKRLDREGAERRSALMESQTLASLKKLTNIQILSGARLAAIEQELSDLKVCYELNPAELKTSPICPHCRYSPAGRVKNVEGQLDQLEARMNDLLSEWTTTLLQTISDPIVASQMEYLSPDQRSVMENFAASGTLPEKVDDHFVKSIQALLRGFDPVVIDPEELIARVDEIGPCEASAFKNRLIAIVDEYTRGKDLSKLRIIVKKR